MSLAPSDRSPEKPGGFFCPPYFQGQSALPGHLICTIFLLAPPLLNIFFILPASRPFLDPGVGTSAAYLGGLNIKKKFESVCQAKHCNAKARDRPNKGRKEVKETHPTVFKIRWRFSCGRYKAAQPNSKSVRSGCPWPSCTRTMSGGMFGWWQRP